jgi:hypothetical protein
MLGIAGVLLLAAAPVFATNSHDSISSALYPTTGHHAHRSALWYTHQVRASKLIGASVVNTTNETISDINEIVLGKDGKVAAVIIGVGGVWGMGEREVAVNFDSIRMSRDQNNSLVVTANATRDLLKDAPQWRTVWSSFLRAWPERCSGASW